MNGSYDVFQACVACDWVAARPWSARSVCPECGDSVHNVVGRWVYFGRLNLPLHFERRESKS